MSYIGPAVVELSFILSKIDQHPPSFGNINGDVPFNDPQTRLIYEGGQVRKRGREGITNNYVTDTIRKY